MVTFSMQQYLAQLSKGYKRVESESEPAQRESKLHEEIIKWCEDQWFPWVVLRARMDKKSTINKGAHDLTIFGPHPVCICVEAKARDEKQTTDQLIWATRLRVLGWSVYVVRSLEEFIKIAENQPKNNQK